MRAVRLFVLICAVTLFGALSAAAAEWMAERVRGQVFVLVDDHWRALPRGGIVPDMAFVRTGPSGRARLVRGSERVDLAGDTQIRIDDREGGTVYTTVHQDFGEVTVEADVRQVEHFSVVTPQLAAVVKGTRFVVSYADGVGSVGVLRGHVGVTNSRTGANVVLGAGQRVSLADGAELALDGADEISVVDEVVVPPGQVGKAEAKAAKAAEKAADKAEKAAEKAEKAADKAADKAAKAAAKAEKKAD